MQPAVSYNMKHPDVFSIQPGIFGKALESTRFNLFSIQVLISMAKLTNTIHPTDKHGYAAQNKVPYCSSILIQVTARKALIC